MKTVLLPKVSDELTHHWLSQRGYHVVTCENPGAEEILRLAPNAAAVMMISKPIPNDLYALLPNLEILARRGVGYDAIDVETAAAHGVWVTNAPGANAQSVAELALMDLLMLARNFGVVNHLARNGEWGQAYATLGHELRAEVVGIVGFGHVGQALAQLLHALGVKVLLYDRHPQATTLGTFVSWDELFQQADYVSVHLAATPETKHCIGARELALMKPTASLVNLARGSVVDNQALYQALTAKTIAQAALDVFEAEPLPLSDPLYQLPNVIMTPHIGADTLEANRVMAEIAARQIDLVLSGHTPEYPVNHPGFK
ncbi:phosphoglycerate dehydrogenase [Lacticaseibacillus jixiensis]|uniref:phosphoglycerate dehydrogenase n=1 Tax=Lacticaseibacillus jixiensis TaxID=3231926 RepID=UPI0036F3CDDC